MAPGPVPLGLFASLSQTVASTAVGTEIGAIGAAGIGTGAGAAAGASAVLGPIGLIIQIASVVLSFLLRPKTEIGRIESLDLSGISEGNPIFRVFGQNIRVPGQVIWVGNIEENEDSSKKGAGIVSNQANFAVAFAKGPVTQITRMFANGKVFFDSDNDSILNSNLLFIQSAAPFTLLGIFGSRMRIKGIDFSTIDLVSNIPVTFSGWINPVNNGTFRVLAVSSSVLIVFGEGVTFIPEPAGPTISITQVIPPFTRNIVQGVTLYTGTLTQLPDPLMEATEGAGNVPGYRGTAYAVFSDFQISQFGNRLPEIDAVLQESVNKTVGETVSDLLLDAGMDASQFDTSALTDSLTGFLVEGPQSTVNPLTLLQMAYMFAVQEVGKQLVFVDRKVETPLIIDQTKLASGEARPFKVEEAIQRSLPAEITVKFKEDNFDGQISSQSFRRYGFESDTKLSLNLESLMLSSSQAQDIARNYLWSVIANSEKVSFSLPISQLKFIESTFATLSDRRILIDNIQRGDNGLLKFEAVREIPELLLHSGSPADIPPSIEQIVEPIPLTDVLFIDQAALNPEEVSKLGFYILGVYTDPLSTWKGADIWESLDDVTYNKLAKLNAIGLSGSTLTALPDGATENIDQISTVRIDMMVGSIASVSLDELLEGANFVQIGNELLSFQTATPVSGEPTQWDLSNFIRGQRNTEGNTATHVAGEMFTFCRQVGMHFNEIAVSTISQTRYYKIVPTGADIVTISGVAHFISSGTIVPFAPTNIVRNGNVISWFRRTRAFWDIFSDSEFPNLEGVDSFQVDIFSDNTFTNRLTILYIVNQSEVTITNALLTSLGLTFPINIRVFHISNTTPGRRGLAAQVTI